LRGKRKGGIARPELIRIPPRPEDNRLKRRIGRFQRPSSPHPTIRAPQPRKEEMERRGDNNYC